jgi:hypothetical protein
MRLYTRTGATALDHPVFGHYDADEHGGFDFPNELSDQLHGFASGGRPLWETDVERQRRLISEELERRKDPATLLQAVEQLVAAARTVGVAKDSEGAEEPASPVKATRARRSPAKAEQA